MGRSSAKLIVFALVVALLPTTPAAAFKPYTHMVTAATAYDDAVDDGRVTILDRQYAVRPELVAALRAWPSYYRAGVIGPDGWPELVYGQEEIHPTQTGKWLEYLLAEAWRAQDSRRSDDEKGQILAFAYGYLTHAAGDVWAHTIVNDISEGTFPEVGDILTEADKASIAIRHIIVEGYIGDATPGFDGNGDWDPAVGSDDSTPEMRLDAPHAWLHDTLIDPNRALPVGTCFDGRDDDGDGVADDGCPGGPFTVGEPEPQRGKLVDFFLDMRARLELRLAQMKSDRAHMDCAGDEERRRCRSEVRTFEVETVRGLQTYSQTRRVCQARVCAFNAGDLADHAKYVVAIPYLRAWIRDIDQGLEAWGRVGTATSRALFDPAVRRRLQNEECRSQGGERLRIRRTCESEIGVTDVVLDQIDGFINDNLLSMLGAPDFVGTARRVVGTVMDFIEEYLGFLVFPITGPTNAIKDRAKQFLLDFIKDSYGIDIDLVKSFLTSPTWWLDVERTSIELPAIGTVDLELFGPEDHEFLDDVLDLPEDHHTTRNVRIPGIGTVPSSELADDAEYGDSALINNVIMLSKLTLLDGTELNRMADRVLETQDVHGKRLVQTWQDTARRPANIMVDGLVVREGSTQVPWLKSIDADHAWRANGLPRFSSVPDPEAHDVHGGNGNFPLWESCVLRPVFRELFTDWETDPDRYPRLRTMEIDDPNFPSLRDRPRRDALTDPDDPIIRVDFFDEASTSPDGVPQFDGGGEFRLVAADDFWTNDHITLEYQFFKSRGEATRWIEFPHGSRHVIPRSLSVGEWDLRYRFTTPCPSAEHILFRFEPIEILREPPRAPDGTDIPPDVIFPGGGSEFGPSAGIDIEIEGDDVNDVAATVDGIETDVNDLGGGVWNVETPWFGPGDHNLVITINQGELIEDFDFTLESGFDDLLDLFDLYWQVDANGQLGPNGGLPFRQHLVDAIADADSDLTAALAHLQDFANDMDENVSGMFGRPFTPGYQVDAQTIVDLNENIRQHALDVIDRLSP